MFAGRHEGGAVVLAGLLMTKPKTQRVTIVDIAREAGVSTSTVSLVLRKSGRISQGTVTRVHDVIRRLGYTYNRNAATLRQQKSSQIIGLVINDIRNPFFAELTAGVQQGLEGTDVMFFLTDTKNDVDQQDKVCRSLREYGVRGLIIFPATGTRKRFFRDLTRDNSPVCVILRNPGNPLTNYIGPDNREAGRLAVRHLLSLGHRRIAYLGGESEGQARMERVEGYCEALREAGIEPDPELNLAGPADRAASAALVLRLLAMPERATAALCHNDNVAISAMHTLRGQGLTPGRDFAIVGIDGIREGQESLPGLTSVQMFGAEIGRRSVQLLLARMQGGDMPTEAVTLRPELIVRGSCGGLVA